MLLSAAAFIIPLAAARGQTAGSDKLHLPVEKLKDIIATDFQEGQYYITGHLTKGIFASDCSFKDPTTNVKGGQHHPCLPIPTCFYRPLLSLLPSYLSLGPEVYSRAVALLFDQSSSRADLLDIKVS